MLYGGKRILVFPLLHNTLQKHIKNISQTERIQFAEQLLRAIAQFHKIGIIHCDLKPENVMLTAENNIKVIDFGSACSAK